MLIPQTVGVYEDNFQLKKELSFINFYSYQKGHFSLSFISLRKAHAPSASGSYVSDVYLFMDELLNISSA